MKKRQSIFGKILAFIVAIVFFVVSVISTACLFNSDFRRTVENKLDIEQTIELPVQDSNTSSDNQNAEVEKNQQLILELKNQIEEKDEEIAEKETALAIVNAELETARSENSENLELIVSLESEKTSLESDIETLTSEKSTLEKEVSDLEVLLQDCYFKVEFIVDDVVESTNYVKYNDYASCNLNPEKEGYIFGGWSVNGVLIDLSSYKIKENTQFVVVFNEPEPMYTFYATTFNKNINGQYVWHVGNDIFAFNINDEFFIYDKDTSSWNQIVYDAINVSASYIWTDGDYLYSSCGSDHKYFDIEQNKWRYKDFGSMEITDGQCTWTDGENIYYSNDSNHYVLDKTNQTWSAKEWSGLSSFYGSNVWTDGENIYYSYLSKNYILNKDTDTWSQVTFSGLDSINYQYIWVDATNVYYSQFDTHYVLNKSTRTWESIEFFGIDFLIGQYIWTDGENIFHSDYSTHYRLSNAHKTA